MATKSAPPSTSTEFDHIYNAPLLHWAWSDVRIPGELKQLVATKQPRTSLELGCGLGRFSDYLARQGVAATGVDFSAVAIDKARQRVAHAARQPTFQVGDVTNLAALAGPFDVALDVGCFHCLDAAGQAGYAAEAHRLLRPGATLLLWAIDDSPSSLALGPATVARVFAEGFRLEKAAASRRRLVAAHWYWLVRS